MATESSESVSVKTNVTPEPPPSAINLHETIAALNTYQTEIASQQALAQINVNKQQIAQQQLEQDTKDANEIKIRLEGKKLDEEQKTLGQVHELQRAYGVDPNDASTYILTTLGEQSRQATNDYLSAADELNRRETVSFWDSPLDWIAAQYTIDGQRQLTHDLASKAQTADERLRSMVASVNAGAEQIALANKTMDDGDKADRLNLIKLAADSQLAELQIKNYGTAVDSIAKINAMTHQQAQLQLQGLHAQQENRKIAISEAHLLLSKQEFSWKKTEKENNDKILKEMVSYVNLGASGMGDSRVYNESTIRAMREFPESRARIDQYFAAGVANAAVASQEGGKTDFRYVGKTPGESAYAYAATGLPGAPGSQEMTKILMQKFGEVKQQFPQAKPDEVISKVNTLVKQERDRWASNAEAGGSPIAVTNLQVALAGDSTLKNSAFYKEVMAPLVEKGKLAKFDIDTAVAIGADAVLNKKATLKEAGEFFSHFYTAGVQQQQIRNNFSGNGVAPITDYTVRTNVGSFGTHDYTKSWKANDAVQFQHAINMKIRSDSLNAESSGIPLMYNFK